MCGSIDEALILTQSETMKQKIENIFVIGGGEIYKQAILLPECTKVYLTVVDDTTPCDTFFPSIPSFYSQTVCLGTKYHM